MELAITAGLLSPRFIARKKAETGRLFVWTYFARCYPLSAEVDKTKCSFFTFEGRGGIWKKKAGCATKLNAVFCVWFRLATFSGEAGETNGWKRSLLCFLRCSFSICAGCIIYGVLLGGFPSFFFKSYTQRATPKNILISLVRLVMRAYIIYRSLLPLIRV